VVLPRENGVVIASLKAQHGQGSKRGGKANEKRELG
jgi:hypothetical protein